MNVVAFTTTARQGDARAPGALSRLLASKQWPLPAACAEQVHEVRIRLAGKLRRARTLAGADGLLTSAPDQPLAIFTADCVPIFLRGDPAGVVGLLHAGWRGVRGRILVKATGLMRRRWHLKGSQIQAWAGPSIGPCCFQVHWDVARHFPSTRRRRGSGEEASWTVDLVGELRHQAKRLGIRWVASRSLGGGGGCTMHGSRYYSYRRDKTSKRQVSVIMKRIP